MEEHVPVMCKEVIEYLRPKPGKIILDCTLGGGGHSKAILQRISPQGRLIGIDQDEQALRIAREKLRKYKGLSTLVHDNFHNLDAILNKLKITKVDGVLFDLGISSFQLEDARRGFSIKLCGPLDMRMDRKNESTTAYKLVNGLPQAEIVRILKTFGEERWARRIASRIVKERQKAPIDTTTQLAKIVLKAIPYSRTCQKIHPATRTFQALRIAVNKELSSLEEGVSRAIRHLNPEARICVISFHSLEDRIVKSLFREFSQMGLLKVLTQKPIRPHSEEVRLNPRSRSAKLRVGERGCK
jgi:16S rRNA (cytosine1402-N4)-methyltransferase